MNDDQELSWLLLLAAMIQGDQWSAAKLTVTMGVLADESAEWFEVPCIVSFAALTRLLTDYAPQPAGDEPLAIQAAEGAAALGLSIEDCLELLGEARGQNDAERREGQMDLIRELWKALTLCSVIARQQDLEPVGVLARAYAALDDAGNW